MYAVVEAGGKQIRVEEGKEVLVDNLSGKPGEKVVLDKVLLHHDQGQLHVGHPYVPGAKVEAVLVGTARGKKIRVFKYKPKKRYRKTMGHRQSYTRLRIEKIILGGLS